MRSAESGWGSGEVLGFLALAVVLLAAFVFIEQRSVEPLVRLSIFWVKTVRGANVAMFVVAAGMFAMFFFNTLYVQRVLGLLAARGGSRVPPVHARDHHRRGLAQPLRAELGPREVPLIGSALGAVGLLLFLRLGPDSTYFPTCSADHAHLDRDGPRLRAGDADRDERRARRRRRSGLGALQHLAADRRRALGLALLTTLSTNRTEDELSSLGRREPTPADTAEALVSGFHVTWLASAILIGAGGLLLVALVRRRDAVAVAHGGEVSPVAV